MGYHRVYIGRLPRDVKKHEVEKLTEEFGRSVEISVHSGFAFVEFNHERGARDCVHNLDGERYAGARIRVEPARSQTSRYWRDSAPVDTPRYQSNRCARSEYRVIVHNLPSRVSWQDLKDLMRKAGEVVFTDIAEDGSGIVEFSNSSQVAKAIELFNNYEFQGKIIHASEDEASKRSPLYPSSRRRESPLSDRSDRSRSPPIRRYRSRTPPMDSNPHSPRSRARFSNDRPHHPRFNRRSSISKSPSNSPPSSKTSPSPISSPPHRKISPDNIHSSAPLDNQISPRSQSPPLSQNLRSRKENI